MRPLNQADFERYRLLFGLSATRKKVAEAKRIINQAFADAHASRWYVACSFGKDSMALQHLVRGINPDVTVVFIDDQASYTPFDYALIKNYSQAIPNFIHLRWDKVAYMQDNDNPYPRGNLHQTMFEPLFAWLKAEPHDGLFMGLRKEESVGRLFSMAKHGAIHQYQTGAQKGSWRCVPLQNWAVDQVGAYLIGHDLPILDIYLKMGFEARSGVFGSSNAHLGRIAYLRQHCPADYERYISIVPDARNYT